MRSKHWEEFFLVENNEKEILKTFSAIYVLTGTIEVNNEEIKITAQKNDFIKSSGSCCIKSENARCLIATYGFSDKNMLIRNNETLLYNVKKPWGTEIWLNHEDEDYGFVMKSIYINSGHRTSLQVHEKKHECMYMDYGNCNITYCDEGKYNVLKSSYKTKVKKFLNGTFQYIAPGEIHRLEALNDIHILEISSRHLDDVIRIQDDTLRPNGRIENEHR